MAVRLRGWIGIALALIGALGAPAAGEAAEIITSFSGGTQLGQACAGLGGGNTAGWKFTVGPTGLLATALGAFDRDGDGLGMSVQVGLWDSGGTLLGMVVVPSGTGPTLIGSFRYVDLTTPVELMSGQSYTIGARCTGISGGGGYAPLDGPAFTFSSDFASAGGRYNNGGLSTFFSEPTMDLGGSIFLGPNLVYGPLPPGTPTATFTNTVPGTPTQTPTVTETATATGTATQTPTVTASATPTATPTPAPNGVACTEDAQCISGFCVDGFCCNSACTGASEACNVPLNVGTCTDLPQAAPAASSGGLIAGIALLAAVAAGAMLRARRQT